MVLKDASLDLLGTVNWPLYISLTFCVRTPSIQIKVKWQVMREMGSF